VRYKAKWVEHLDALASQEGGTMDTNDAIHRSECDRVLEEHQLEKALDVARWDREKAREERKGIVMDLWLRTRVRVEGGILPVETIPHPGTVRLRLTGSCADVVDTFFPPVLGDQRAWRASAELGEELCLGLCITNQRSVDALKVPELINIHLHLPAGATKKDGPSAGVAMASSPFFPFFPMLSFGCLSIVQDSDLDSSRLAHSCPS